MGLFDEINARFSENLQRATATPSPIRTRETLRRGSPCGLIGALADLDLPQDAGQRLRQRLVHGVPISFGQRLADQHQDQVRWGLVHAASEGFRP